MFKVKLKKRIYVAAASLIYIILSEGGILNVAPEAWDQWVNTIAFILTGLGIVSTPEKPTKEEA
jgi:uncharacterized membrane protein